MKDVKYIYGKGCCPIAAGPSLRPGEKTVLIRDKKDRALPRRNRAQSVLEYALMVTVISMAITAMYTYFQRAMNARLEDIRQEFTPRYAGK